MNGEFWGTFRNRDSDRSLEDTTIPEFFLAKHMDHRVDGFTQRVLGKDAATTRRVLKRNVQDFVSELRDFLPVK